MSESMRLIGLKLGNNVHTIRQISKNYVKTNHLKLIPPSTKLSILKIYYVKGRIIKWVECPWITNE